MPGAPSPATVVVPTVHGGRRLARLLDSLGRQSAEHRVVVVDNGSRDPSIGKLGRQHDAVDVVSLDRNLGFSRAVNLGAQHAEGEVLIVVNDDCECEPGFVEEIAGALDPAAGVAMASGVMRDQGNPSLIDTAGIEIDETLLAFDYLNGVEVSVLDGRVDDPFGPSGAAAAFDRETFDRIGGFDESIFAYLEDVDLAIRMRLEGARCALAGAARGTHFHSATLGAGSARKNYLAGFGRGYLLRKWSVLSLHRLLPVLSREVSLCLGQALIDRNLQGAKGRVRGYRSARTRNAYPEGVLRTGARAPGLRESLRRRTARRRRLRARGRDVSAGAGTGLRTLAIFHLPDVSGPFLSLSPHLHWLAEHGSLDVAMPGGGLAADSIAEFAEVKRLRYEALTTPTGIADAVEAMAAQVRDIASFRKLIRELRPDLIIGVTGVMPAALLAARIERVPSLLYAGEILAGAGTESRSRARRLSGSWLVGLNARAATAVIACSDIVGAQYRARGHRAVVTIEPPIGGDYADGDGPGFRSRHGIGADDLCIACVGSLTEGRGQDLLLRAVALIRPRHPKIRCVIVGSPHPRDGDRRYASELSRLADQLGIGDATTFCGFVEQVADVYAAADVVVNPVRVAEGFGRVAFEAGVAGCPVVSTDIGGPAASLRDGESALLVPPEDPTGIAVAIERLLADRDLGERLAAAAGRQAREELSTSRSHERFVEVLRATLPEGRCP